MRKYKYLNTRIYEYLNLIIKYDITANIITVNIVGINFENESLTAVGTTSGILILNALTFDNLCNISTDTRAIIIQANNASALKLV